MTYFDQFNDWFKNKHQNLITTSMPSYKRWFISEMYSFYSISNSILDTWTEDDFIKHPEVLEMAYPQIRRLLESYFRILYIFNDESKIKERFNTYVEHIKALYSKAYNDISEMDENLKKENVALKSLLDLLPKPMPGKTDKFFDNVKSMLEQVRNEDGKNFGSFYIWYRITSFYSHGNINKEIWDNISPSNANFLVLGIKNLINLIANTYIVKIKELNL